MSRMDSLKHIETIKMRLKRILFNAIESVIPNTTVKNIPPISNDTVIPEVFNKYGERIKLCYLLSPGSEHHPYGITDGRVPQFILWDRFNFKLDIHFYSSESIFTKQLGGKKHYGLLLESETIIPDVYNKIRKRQQYVEDNLDTLFTHSKEILSLISNAKFCPAYSVWYGTPKWGGTMIDYQEKSKMLSFVGCDKAMTQMHYFRQEVTHRYLNSEKVDVMGKAVNRFASCNEIYSPYRYNIALENASYDYYFTEKIMNCFAAKTVPIYYGCPSIGDFFNTDGIIVVKEPTLKAIESALALCNEQDYELRKAAIDDNYNRVKKYLCVEDFLCNHYSEILEIEKK